MKTQETVTKSDSKSHEYENSLTKLFLHSNKSANIVGVCQEKIEYDSSLPICIEIHLTNKCNLLCEWCIDKHIRGKNEEIPFSSLLRLLDFLEGSQIGFVIEGGGEPTLHSKFNEFVLECNKRNISTGLITNGTTRLKKETIDCFDFIRVSTDATSREEYIVEKGKDYFDTIIDNVRFIRECNKEVTLGLSYVLTQRNYKNIYRLFDIISDMNINYVRLRNIEENDELSLTESMMGDVQNTIDKYKDIVSTKMVLSAEVNTNQENNNNLPCVAHSLRSVIHANGDVVMCTKRRHDPIILGNINETEFLDIWNSEKRIDACKKLMDRKNQVGCTICRITKYNELFYNLVKVKTRNFI